jgi:hypothetical protein
MIRAHEFCEYGSNWTFDECLTVFSACDYCNKGNMGAVAVITEGDTVTVKEFKKCRPESLPHLLHLPEWFLETGLLLEPCVTEEMEMVWLSV